MVASECTFNFSLYESYVNKVMCDVVHLDVCQVILGSPYLWDRDAVLSTREKQYTFTKDGEFVVKEVQGVTSEAILPSGIS